MKIHRAAIIVCLLVALCEGRSGGGRGRRSGSRSERGSLSGSGRGNNEALGSDRSNLRRAIPRCQRDNQCPQISCIQAPCPQLVCMNGLCLQDKLPPATEELESPPECKSSLECPQVRCALGYPCPTFECQGGMCTDVSNGEPFAPCLDNEDCFQEGDACFQGKCVKASVPTLEIENQCSQDFECPQPACMWGVECPEYVCKDGQCVPKVERQQDSASECVDDYHCPQPGCRPGHFCPTFVCVRGQCVEEQLVACTEDAKLCPDGSYVSREGPNCEFAECPQSYIKCKERQDCPQVRCMFGAPGCPDYHCDTEQGICVDLNEANSDAADSAGESCGWSICGKDEYCCNPSCSICAAKPDGMCTQQACGFQPRATPELEAVLEPQVQVLASCCADPRPSDLECGRSGCHCCGNGKWLLGNSGPTLSATEACGDFGASNPCE